MRMSQFSALHYIDPVRRLSDLGTVRISHVLKQVALGFNVSYFAKHHHHQEWNDDAVIVDMDNWEAPFCDFDTTVLPGDTRLCWFQVVFSYPTQLGRRQRS